jgi:hypothetical protein
MAMVDDKRVERRLRVSAVKNNKTVAAPVSSRNGRIAR